MYLYVNKAMEAFTQVASCDLIGKKCSELGTTRQQLDFWIERYTQSKETKLAMSFEVGPNDAGRLFSCTAAHVKGKTQFLLEPTFSKEKHMYLFVWMSLSGNLLYRA